MNRLSSPSRAINEIQSGDEIILDTSRPTSVLNQLKYDKNLDDIQITLFGNPYLNSDPLPELARQTGYNISISMVPPDMRDMLHMEGVDYVPRTLYQMVQNPSLYPDRRTVAIIETPSFKSHDTINTGCLNTFIPSLLEHAEISIIEENNKVPTPSNSEKITTSAIDYCIKSNRNLPRLADGNSAVSEDVGINVASLIPQESTIQLGIGGVMRSVGQVLSRSGEYSLYTGLLGESARPLFEANKIKTATCCVAIGSSSDFYNWITDNDPSEFVSAAVSHSPQVLARQENFVAINSALQVDLYGQINAETLNGRQVSGVGGQSVFMNAASNNPSGCAIIALESRAPNGESKIIPKLSAGDVVTTPRYSVDAVVTEYGIADLTNSSVEDRVDSLIGVAHPDSRPHLKNSARERGLI